MKVACSKCEKVIDADHVKRDDWLKVNTEHSTFLLCNHCADGFWMAVDSELPPVVGEKGGNLNTTDTGNPLKNISTGSNSL